MLVDIAKPIALLLCLVALYAVFCTAFMTPDNLESRLWASLELLALAAGMSLISGLIFRESEPEASIVRTRLIATLPVQVFFWASGIMFFLFILSWYLETYCIFYRNVYF